jgi:glyoxylase-like metal-dependent hydrolase (beta-lactamase superfamily II)
MQAALDTSGAPGAPPTVRAFFDPATFTVTYVVSDPGTRDAVIIDPVLDYDPTGSRISEGSAESVAEYVRAEGLRVHYLLETHAHADHLSGSPALQRRFADAKIAIGERIREVQAVFRDFFDLGAEFPVDGRQFDRLLRDGERIEAGALSIEAIATPGHTPACMSFRIGDALFTGDALFMPDYGAGRCDFPRGSAEDLYDSITGRIYALPEETRVFVGHDYQPNGRELRYETSVGESRRSNVQIPADRPRAEFVNFRKRRDAELAAPRLLYPSVQVNINGGHLPASAANGKRYLKIPLNEAKS